MSARIAPAEAPFPEAVQAQLDKLMPPGVPPLALFTTLARDERLFARFMGGGLLDKGHLTLRQRELVIDRITARCGCEYEWGVHVAFYGERVALTEAENRSIVHGGPEDACWSEPSEQLILRLCDALDANADIDDALWAELSEHFAEEALLEMMMLCGFYRVVSYVANAARIPLEAFGARFPAKG